MVESRLLPGELNEDGAPDYYDLYEAARACQMHVRTLRNKIHNGSLRAITPLDAHPKHLGRGGRYRIRRVDLQAWYFGETKPGQFAPPGGYVPVSSE